jgi:hypothetical protein
VSDRANVAFVAVPTPHDMTCYESTQEYLMEKKRTFAAFVASRHQVNGPVFSVNLASLADREALVSGTCRHQ